MVVKALIAIVLWAATATGYLFGRLSVIERVVAFVAAATLILAMPMTDEIGFSLAGAFIAWHFWQSRRQKAAVGA